MPIDGFITLFVCLLIRMQSDFPLYNLFIHRLTLPMLPRARFRVLYSPNNAKISFAFVILNLVEVNFDISLLLMDFTFL